MSLAGVPKDSRTVREQPKGILKLLLLEGHKYPISQNHLGFHITAQPTLGRDRISIHHYPRPLFAGHPLTSNGEDHHDEVKHIPAESEVVMPEGEHLQDALGREDGHEELVDSAEDLGLLFTLIVSLHHHGDHIETNEDHDGDVKSLLGYNVKDKALVLVLRKERMGRDESESLG